jgi:hypothetical protein
MNGMRARVMAVNFMMASWWSKRGGSCELGLELVWKAREPEAWGWDLGLAHLFKVIILSLKDLCLDRETLPLRGC